MKSKFTIKTYFTIILFFAVIFTVIKVIPTFFNNPYYEDKIFPKIFVPSILILTLLFLVGELRTKIIIVKIENNQLEVRRFFGLKIETYKFSEITGWKYSHQTSKGGTYEYLYLYKNDKKTIKISEFYHKNYFLLKNEIEIKIKYLGYEQFSFIDEFKEIFT
ncbi:hypothetical protein [Chryseobacterium sp. YIM B08800]|uniref:hypothetical protein n=1 Tax=Chryseobacterium sp. YIM B08800 TaxID=2984136 RepID=UPI00223EA456|nr:hypothetical protein [Chryseobacterium sp. YIM B08800]